MWLVPVWLVVRWWSRGTMGIGSLSSAWRCVLDNSIGITLLVYACTSAKRDSIPTMSPGTVPPGAITSTLQRISITLVSEPAPLGTMATRTSVGCNVPTKPWSTITTTTLLGCASTSAQPFLTTTQTTWLSAVSSGALKGISQTPQGESAYLLWTVQIRLWLTPSVAVVCCSAPRIRCTSWQYRPTYAVRHARMVLLPQTRQTCVWRSAPRPTSESTALPISTVLNTALLQSTCGSTAPPECV